MVTITVEQDATAMQTALVASTADGVVAADGYWKVCLTQVLSPSLLNHTVHFKGKPSGSVATNVGVLIGNVILCSGQSNMEKPVSYVFNATAEMAAALTLGDRMRTVGTFGPWNNNVDGGAAATPQFDTKKPMKWSRPSVYGFSAVCWMYGRRIYEAYPTTPIGLIESDVGGTAIEPWSPPDALAACGMPYRGFNNTLHSCPPFCNTSSLFNGMIAPLLNYSIHHMIWYQASSQAVWLCFS
jgi:sialate O-acetylesterase